MHSEALKFRVDAATEGAGKDRWVRSGSERHQDFIVYEPAAISGGRTGPSRGANSGRGERKDQEHKHEQNQPDPSHLTVLLSESTEKGWRAELVEYEGYAPELRRVPLDHARS